MIIIKYNQGTTSFFNESIVLPIHVQLTPQTYYMKLSLPKNLLIQVTFDNFKSQKVGTEMGSSTRK